MSHNIVGGAQCHRLIPLSNNRITFRGKLHCRFNLTWTMWDVIFNLTVIAMLMISNTMLVLASAMLLLVNAMLVLFYSILVFCNDMRLFVGAVLVIINA